MISAGKEVIDALKEGTLAVVKLREKSEGGDSRNLQLTPSRK